MSTPREDVHERGAGQGWFASAVWAHARFFVMRYER
jgi:hypothetical protein